MRNQGALYLNEQRTTGNISKNRDVLNARAWKEKGMNSFDELVAARKQWLSEILRPWCQSARRTDLLKAEPDWVDIAGKVDPVKTLWLWAWSRFPELIHESLGIEETSEVEINLHDGRVVRGFPDARDSQQGQLILWGTDALTCKPVRLGPFVIDEIRSVLRRTEVLDDS